MRRGRGAVVLVALVAMLFTSTGCTRAPTVGDGVLGLDWAAMPEPTVPAPAAGVCRQGFSTTVDWTLPGFDGAPVDCSSEHESETIHVGTLTASEVTAVPELGDELFAEAYAECAKQANAFLGGDYRTARIFLTTVLPSDRQWAGGARFYRCELIEIRSTHGTVVRRDSSMRDGLKGTRPLAVTCALEKLTKDKKYIDEITFVGCKTPHDIEFTGLYTAAAGPHPGDEKLYDKALDACYGIGAKYLGLTRSGLDNIGGISWTAWGGGEDSWSVGHRSFWCFMGEYPSRKLRGSIKNRRPGNFPH